MKQRRRKIIPGEMAISMLVRVLKRQRTSRMNTYCNGDTHYMIQAGWSSNSSAHTGEDENTSNPRGWMSQNSQSGARGLEDPWRAPGLQEIWKAGFQHHEGTAAAVEAAG